MQNYRHSKRLCVASLSLAFLVLAVALPTTAQELAKEGTFEGNWDLSGTAQTVEMDDGSLSVMRLEGPVRITDADSGLAREFESVCAGVSDSETGGVGRCVWMDADEDALFLEVGGSIIGPAGTSREAVGYVAGGTGKYAGLEGEFMVDYLFLDSVLNPGTVTLRDTEFTGTWRRP